MTLFWIAVACAIISILLLSWATSGAFEISPAKVCSYRLAEDSEGSHVECTKCFARTDGLEDAYADRAGAIDLWNRRAAPPSGNAGELVAGNGLLDMLGDERKDWRADLERRAEERDLERHTINLAAEPPAPPQPAPDALREVVDDEIKRWENDHRTMYPDSDVLDSLDRIKAALSPAPVPSGEGLPPIDETLHRSEIIASLQQRAVSPSPAGAAEPVAEVEEFVSAAAALVDAFYRANSEKRKSVLEILSGAAPPVRGDREAVLRDVIMGAAKLHTHDHALALKIANDAILSLQSSPGEPLAEAERALTALANSTDPRLSYAGIHALATLRGSVGGDGNVGGTR